LLTALTIFEPIPEHRNYSYALINLGHLETLVGDHERARRYYERRWRSDRASSARSIDSSEYRWPWSASRCANKVTSARH
jgi:hypothetical protein